MITYRDGYKYQLVEPYSIQTTIKPKKRTQALFLSLTVEGMLHIERGYAWDGPSGPAVDTHDFMRGSLVHDALYQLMRRGLLDASYRGEADHELYRICMEDGMSKARALAVHQAVRVFGGAWNSVDKPPLTAPDETDADLDEVNED